MPIAPTKGEIRIPMNDFDFALFVLGRAMVDLQKERLRADEGEKNSAEAIAELSEECAKLKERLADEAGTDVGYKGLKEQLDKLGVANVGQRRTILDLQKKNADLENVVSDLTEECDSKGSSMSALEKPLAEARTELQTSAKVDECQRKDIDALESACDTKDHTIKELRARIVELSDGPPVFVPTKGNGNNA